MDKQNIPVVLISIQPRWCDLIASGQKTLELRKSAPKTPVPFRVVIYQTGEYASSAVQGQFTGKYKPGSVIGEFICDQIIRNCESANLEMAERLSCVSKGNIQKYGNGKEVVGWHISNLQMYNEPKKLKDIGKRHAPQSWYYLSGNEGEQ